MSDLAAEGLTDEQAQIQAIAKEFAMKELAPNMSTWDAQEEFPISTLKKSAELGFGGLWLRVDEAVMWFY